ncbi:uncharacterized protein [Palaemon carinicauda]|uniref:uncharacterized protein isoform X2 n=1 Tax=Palaemon carinicauda TaxID=392227 RepID=UPI0035B60790
MLKKIQKLLKKEKDRTSGWKKIFSTEIQDATLAPGLPGYQGPVEIGKVAFPVRDAKPQNGVTSWYKRRNNKVKTAAKDVVIHYDANHFEENHQIAGNITPDDDDPGFLGNVENDRLQGECGRSYDSESPNLHEEHDQETNDSGEACMPSSEKQNTDCNDLLHGAVPNEKCTIFSGIPELPVEAEYTDHTGRYVMPFGKQNADSLCDSADIPNTLPEGTADFDLLSGNICRLPLASRDTLSTGSSGEPTSSSVIQNCASSVGTLTCLGSIDKVPSSEIHPSHPVEVSASPFDTTDEHQNVSEASYSLKTHPVKEEMVSANKESTLECVNQVISKIYAPSKEMKMQSIDDEMVSVEECQASCDVQTINSDENYEAYAPKGSLFCEEIGASNTPSTSFVKDCREQIPCSDETHSLPVTDFLMTGHKATVHTNYPFSIVKRNNTPMAKVKPRVRNKKSNLSSEEVPLPKVLDFSGLLIELYPLEKILFKDNFVPYSLYESIFSLLFVNPEISFTDGSRNNFSLLKKKDCENCHRLTVTDGFHLSHLVVKGLKQDKDMNSSQFFMKNNENIFCLTEGSKYPAEYSICSNHMAGEITSKEKPILDTNPKIDKPTFQHSSSHNESNDGAVSIPLFAEQEMTTTSDAITKKVAVYETLDRENTSKLSNDNTNVPPCRKVDDMDDYEENSSVLTSKKQQCKEKIIPDINEILDDLIAECDSLSLTESKQADEPISESVTQHMESSTEVMTNETVKRKPLEITSCTVDNTSSIVNDKMNLPLSKEEEDLLERPCKGDDLHMLELSIASNNPTCLYNHEGEICTIKKARYIMAYLPNCGKLVHVNIKIKEMFGAKVGCQIVWDGQTPMPVFDVKDGSKVKFDAIFLKENNSFQALIMWKNVKPNSVVEPSNRGYTLIRTEKVIFKKLYISEGKKYAQVYMERTKILAEILKGAVFVNGKRSDFASLFSSPGPIFCRVSKLMCGRQGGYYIYVCSCIWSGCLPPELEVPITFKKGHIYRLGQKGTFVPDLNPLCMYCDLSGLLKGTLVDCVLEFNVESNAITMPLSIEDLHFGHYKIKVACNPYSIPVKVHVLRASESKWHVLLLQLSDNDIPEEILSTLREPKPKISYNREDCVCDSPKRKDPLQRRERFSQMSLAEDIEASYKMSACKDNNKDPKTDDSGEEISEKYRQMSSKNIHTFLQTLVTGSEATAITELDGDSEKQKEAKDETCAVSNETGKKNGKDTVTTKAPKHHGKNKASGRLRNYNPKVIEDATGYLTSVVGDYGLLKLRNKQQLAGQVMAVFHKSVVYINRWPLYKDLLLCEQLENLSSNTWHCSLEQSRGCFGGMEVDYKATLAWQGFKPTKDDVHYFETLPSDNPFWYSNCYKMDGNLETLVYYNGIYNDRQPPGLQCQLSSEIDDIDEADLSDFINLFPTLTSDCEVEIVDVSD